MQSQRQYTPVDEFISGLSSALETLFAKPRATRNFPATASDNEELSASDRVQSGRYMRVNHVGEICAQALYQSQAITASDADTRESMRKAADEEVDHLAWCEQRIEELGSRKSLLNPLWYAGSFAVGTIAGIAGDRWNLGFVAETERQVADHLEGHLGKLPEKDQRSREIVSQMKEDEMQHGEQAVAAGAAELPLPVKRLMKCAAGVMTRTAYWI